MNEQQNNNADLLNIISILLAVQNLQENREQTKQNDVQAANDRQAEYLMNKIDQRFDKQNQQIYIIKEKVDKMYNLLEEIING